MPVRNNGAVIIRAVERLRRIVPRGDLSRGVLTLVAGTGVAQVIAIASSPVLTRLYSPSDYGVFSVAVSLLAVLFSVSCLSYHFAIPLPEADLTAANVLALCLLTTLAMAFISGIILWLAGPALLALFGASALGPYVLLLVLGQLGGGVVTVFTSWAVRTKAFSGIAAARLTQACTLVAVQVGLGTAGFGALGLFLGTIAGSASGSTRLARAAWRTHASSFRLVSWRGILTAAKRYRRFAILSTPSALLNTLGLQAPLLLLVALYGAQVGGQYALAERIVALPVALVAGAVGQVYTAEAARLARQQPSALRTLFGRTTRSLAGTAVGPAVLIALLAPLLAGPLFGMEWQESGLIVLILTPMYYLIIMTNPTGGTLDVLERQDLNLAREVLRLFLVGGAVLIAWMVGLGPLAAIALLSAAGCLTYALYGLISWYAIATRHAALKVAPVTEADLVRDMAEWPNP